MESDNKIEMWSCEQAVTVRKAEEKGASGSLLAKLHYGVVQFLEDAVLLLRTQIGDWNDISEKFRVGAMPRTY